MKTQDEIKKWMECCTHGTCNSCPYFGDECDSDREVIDTLEYIQQLEHQIGELTEKVAQLEAAQPKWISVEERLPDEPGEVMACLYGRICIVWYSNRCFETPSGMVLYVAENAVTHWMPLPQPPKE